MNELLPRLQANNNGETKCVILVKAESEARRALAPFVSSLVAEYPFISAFGAVVNVHKISDLLRLPCVNCVCAHSTVYACLSRAKSELKLKPFYGAGYYGEGVTVAVIDTGAFPHLDFLMPRPRLKQVDFLLGRQQPYDDNGHGTAVCGTLAGNGLVSGGLLSGISPKSDIISLKAIEKNGEGGAFAILEAMQWVYTNRDKYNIKVLCMSFGADCGQKNDPLVLGAEALWAAGVTVVASSGNSGPGADSVKSPAVSKKIITVGAALGADEGFACAPFTSVNADKPDVLAPGVDVLCPRAGGLYTALSGTSISAPMVAGLCALALSIRPSLRPDKLKEMLLDCRGQSGGAGMLDCEKFYAALAEL